MQQSSNVLAVLWWTVYTLVGIWAHKVVPGVDFFAPGIILSMQEQAGHRTVWLAIVWILLIEGMGNLPFGYGLAWYGSLATMYFVGRWLFEGRSVLFMCLLGMGMGVTHTVLVYFLSQLAGLTIPLKPVMMQGVIQAVVFPVVWMVADHFFPKRLRLDVRPL